MGEEPQERILELQSTVPDLPEKLLSATGIRRKDKVN